MSFKVKSRAKDIAQDLYVCILRDETQEEVTRRLREQCSSPRRGARLGNLQRACGPKHVPYRSSISRNADVTCSYRVSLSVII